MKNQEAISSLILLAEQPNNSPALNLLWRIRRAKKQSQKELLAKATLVMLNMLTNGQTVKAESARDTLSKSILSYRKSRGLTQGDLAVQVGCSTQRICQIETGKSKASKELSKKIRGVISK
jgi:transcriptional regulator with XRE-family HTH domain